MAPRDADLKNLNFKANPMGAAMQAALEEEKDTTIFKQVSKRYRAMAPQLGIVKP